LNIGRDCRSLLDIRNDFSTCHRSWYLAMISAASIAVTGIFGTYPFRPTRDWARARLASSRVRPSPRTFTNRADLPAWSPRRWARAPASWAARRMALPLSGYLNPEGRYAGSMSQGKQSRGARKTSRDHSATSILQSKIFRTEYEMLNYRPTSKILKRRSPTRKPICMGNAASCFGSPCATARGAVERKV
jgi:hypothetical protein